MKPKGQRKKSNWGWAGRAGLDVVQLREQYLQFGDAGIARKYEVTDVAVAQLRKKWGVPALSPRQRKDRTVRLGMPSLDDLTPVTLAELYAHMGERQIAALYGVQKPAIARLRTLWGIRPISKSDRATSSAEMTDEQKECVLGTLLGDGHLKEGGVLKVTHGHDQIGYLQRLHALLTPHVLPVFYEEKVMESGQVCFAFGFRTVQNVWLQALREVFYGGGKKIFPESVLQALAPRSLAYWYFDDGHLDSGLPSFALGDISEKEALRVIELTGKRFGLDTYLKPQSTPTCQLLGVRGHSADTFFHLIRDYATQDMLYKMPPKHWPSGLVPKIPVRTAREVARLPTGLVELCKEWPSKTPPEKDKTLDSIQHFWAGAGFPHQVTRLEELVTLMNLTPEQVIQDGVIKNRQVGQATCHALAPHIWRAKSYEGKYSPAEIFEDTNLFRELLLFILQTGGTPTGAEIRSALRIWKRSGVYNFRPSAAKVLTDRYCPSGGLVWDTCAGYGGRLMGVTLSRARPRYLACEPQPETFSNLVHLTKWLDDYLPGVASRVALHNVPAEDFDPPPVDMVLTSPPYWKKETYGQEETQAGNRYTTYAAWLGGFWGVVLEKAVRVLRPGGWLVLNVDNFRVEGVKYELVKDTLRICRDLLSGEPEVLKYAMPSMGDTDNHEYVICCVKGQPLVSVVREPPVELSRCGGCGKMVPASGLKEGSCAGCRSVRAVPLKECKGCGKEFSGKRSFHDENCYARWKRIQYRLTHPVKATRLFRCRGCGGTWETTKQGSFRICPDCREKEDLAGRKKVCAYRHCGRPFVDTSSKNSMSYCHEEHRRREKLLRGGKVEDATGFRKPDPVLV